MTSPSPATTEPSIAEQVAALAPAVIDHLNDSHVDELLIVAAAHGAGGADVAVAEVVALTHESFTLRYTTAGGDGPADVTVDYDTPVAELGDIRLRAVEVVAAARARLGIAEPTRAEQEVEAIRALRTHVTSVVAVEQLSPHFKQITFGGGDLATYESTGGLDEFLYVLLPPPGRTELTVDATFSWDAYEAMAPDERPVGAYYTVRRWRPEAAELDLLFVLHATPDGTDGGAAAAWAARAQPGDVAALWGPRTAYAAPADTDWFLLAADETGLPAVGAILEHLPAGTPARVFVELDDPQDQLPLPVRDGVDVTWLFRRGADAGTTTLLADAVRALEHPTGNVYAWGGAESRAMTAIRKHLRHELGIARERVSLTGYWRHASSPADDE
jgi:NADPH-dependent ferric siderophore reductase